MRSVAEYLSKAAEFERLAAESTNSSLRRRYDDIAACYRLLAQDRRRLIEEGIVTPEIE